MATKLKKFTLNNILDRACGNPEDFADYEKWTRSESEKPLDLSTYKGWMRYEVTLHCVTMTIIAKKHPNGGYIVKDWIEREH